MSVRRLRWAIFTVSIISSVDNPSAHLWRAFGRGLQQRANIATFFETRGNRAMQALLQRERSEGLTNFRERFPDLHYQTVDQHSGFALSEWLTRTLATVDIALVDRDASPELIAALTGFSRPFLQTFLVDPGWGPEPLEPASLANLTGVLVGNDALIATYARATDAARVYPFGPLPPTLNEPEPSEQQHAGLDDGVERAIEAIIRVAEQIRRAQGTKIVSNGRADHPDTLQSYEPD